MGDVLIAQGCLHCFHSFCDWNFRPAFLHFEVVVGVFFADFRQFIVAFEVSVVDVDVIVAVRTLMLVLETNCVTYVLRCQ